MDFEPQRVQLWLVPLFAVLFLASPCETSDSPTQPSSGRCAPSQVFCPGRGCFPCPHPPCNCGSFPPNPCVDHPICHRCDEQRVCTDNGVCGPQESICIGYSTMTHILSDRGICDIDEDGRPDPDFDCGVTAIVRVSFSNVCGVLPRTAEITERVVLNGCGYRNTVLRGPEIGSCSPPCEDVFSACFTNRPDLSPRVPAGDCRLTFTQTLRSGNCTITRDVVFQVTGDGKTCAGHVVAF